MIGNLPDMSSSSRCSSDQYYLKKELTSFKIVKLPECLSRTDLDIHRLEIKFLRFMTPAPVPHGKQWPASSKLLCTKKEPVETEVAADDVKYQNLCVLHRNRIPII